MSFQMGSQEAGGKIQIYLQHYIGITPRFSTDVEFANTIGKTIAHEVGHCVGLPHALGTDDKGTVKFLGPSKDEARKDIMAQGLDYAGARRFLLSEPPFLVAIGDAWTAAEAQKGVDYLGMFVGQGGGFDAIETGRDENALPAAPIGAAIPWLFTEPENTFVSGSFDLGSVTLGAPGTASNVRNFTLRNMGDQALVVDRLEFEGQAGFQSTGLGAGLSVAPQTETPFNVRFTPPTTGAAQADFKLYANASEVPYTVTFHGYGQSPNPELRVLIPNNNVGGAAVGSSGVLLNHFATLTNSGSQVLSITGINANPGGGQPQFAVQGLPAGLSPAQPLQLQPGEAVSLGVSFAPGRIGLVRGEIQVTSNDPQTPIYRIAVVGTGLGESGEPLESLDYGHDYVAMESPDFPAGTVLRAQTDANGNFNFFLPSEQRYHAVIFDPISGLVAHLRGTTAASGQSTPLGQPVFLPSVLPDSDGDGLPDDAEFALGTNPSRADTDGDGVSDFVAIQQGIDPLGGQVAITGIVAQVPLTDARDVAVVPGAREGDLLAYVTSVPEGLVAVDVRRGTLPVVIGRLNFPNETPLFVNVDPEWQVAVVTTGRAVHLIDISDPSALALRQSYPSNSPSQAVLVDGFAYFEANFGKLYALNTRSGIIEQEMVLPGNYITSLVRDGSFLYATDPNGLIRIIEVHGAQMLLRGSFTMGGGAGRSVVANGIAYIPLSSRIDPKTGQLRIGGYATWDVSDPSHPAPIADSSVPIGTSETGEVMAVGGSGYGLLMGKIPGGAIGAVLLNVSQPTNTYSVLTRFTLPERPQAARIAAGSAFVADGPAGLLQLNVQSFDIAGQPPIAKLTAVFSDAAPSVPTAELLEGSRFQVQSVVTDDGQLSSVELLINGLVVDRKVTFPALLGGVAPFINGTSTGFIVQVRATDTGGNVGVSAPRRIQLLPDSTPPLLLSVDPAEGEEKFRGLNSIRLSFSEPISGASLNLANFEVVDEAGTVFRPSDFKLRNFNRDVDLTVGPLNLPGAYRLTLHAAQITDGAGNRLGTTDIQRSFRVLEYSIRWARGQAGNWFTKTNWVPQRIPKPSDWVFIGAMTTNDYVQIATQSPLETAALKLEPVRVRGLVSETDLQLFYSELQVDEPFQMNGWLYLSASKLTDTVLVAGPQSGLGGARGPSSPFVTAEGYFSVLERVTLQGTMPLAAQFHLIDSLTLKGELYGRRNRNINQTGYLSITRDTIIHGPGTFRDVPLNLFAGELNAPDRPGPLVTLDADVTFRGALAIGLEGSSCRLLNRGQLLADEPLPFDLGTYYSAVNVIGQSSFGRGAYTNVFFHNDGLLEVSHGYRLLLDADSNTTLINRGLLRAADGGFLWIDAPLQSTRMRCEAGGVVQLTGRNAPLTTNPGEVAELAGPGRWLVVGKEFYGGTVRMLDGAVLEGSPIFNQVTFEGELHNYDWNSRAKQLPSFLTRYDTKVQVFTNLTLNGTIVFHRPSAVEYGGQLSFFGRRTQLDGQGRIEFESSNNFNQIASVADISSFLTIGANIRIHGRNLTLGNIPGTDHGDYPFIDNRGTILTEPGDLLKLSAGWFTNSGVLRLAGTNVVSAFYNFTQAPTGRLEFDLAGTTPGVTHGQLRVGYQAQLDGVLATPLTATYTPTAGSAFELITYQNTVGAFTTLETSPLPGPLQWAPAYQAKSFLLRVTP